MLEASTSKLRPVILVLLLVGALARPSAQDGAAESISASDLASHVGSVATICGQVVTFHCPSPDKTTFLDLDTPYWTEGVSVRIMREARSGFLPRLEDAYYSRNVCATGRVEKKDKRYLVTVETPEVLPIVGVDNPTRVIGPDAVRGCDVGVEVPKVTRWIKKPSAHSRRGDSSRVYKTANRCRRYCADVVYDSTAIAFADH